MDFTWDDSLRALADEARAFGEEAGARRPHREESWITGFDREVSLELGRRGWLGMTWPEQFGGGGRSSLERLVVTEALIETGAPIAATWVGDRQIGPTLIAFGTDAQRDRHLPALIAGAVTWCLGMSEPDAGSDLANLRTRAVSDGGGYVVEGRKIWTSFASDAEFCYLIARTGRDATGHAGLSEFIVDMGSPGIEVTPITDSTGEAHFCEVSFDGVHVPEENLVGELDNSWRQLMSQLEHERGGIDRLLSNRALFNDAVRAADTTDPLVRQEVAAIETEYRLGRLLVIREVLGQAQRSFSAATKVFCTEHEQRVASFISRSAGAHATLAGRPSRASVYAPAYTIQGGTSSILRNIIGERVLGLPK
jgi:alkylation response protein AidB-like acyl-CoA dehydrogenase